MMSIPHLGNPCEREAGQFLESLHYELAVNERIEVRFKLPGEGNVMCRGFHWSIEEATQQVASLAKIRDVYAGVAPRSGEDGTRVGVSRIPALWADLDLKDGYTRKSRLEQLKGLPCFPSVLVWSGGGFHSYWLLRAPAESPEEMDRAELVMRRLAEGLDGDVVHDRSRIMRVPGTYNPKYGEPRPVTLEHCDPDVRYELHQLEEMAEALLKKGVFGHEGKVRREVLGTSREGKRNVALASVAGSLRNRGLDVETICCVLLEVNRLRCEPPLPESEVFRIGRSIGRYPAGSRRYGRSSARRVYRKQVG
jgi:primase-like protein